MLKIIKFGAVLTALLAIWLGGVFLFFPGWVYDSVVFVNRWRAGLQPVTVTVDGVDWSYLAGGQGDPLLLLHGFGADKDHFGALLVALSSRYRLIVPDLPGFGESSRDPSLAYDIPSQTARFGRFVQALGLSGFHLAGASMGGYIAGYYAADHPEEVQSLLLMAPAGILPPVPGKLQQIYEREGRILLLYRSLSEFDDFMRVLFHNPPWLPTPIKRHLVERHSHAHELYLKILADMVNGGMGLLEDRLELIACPTLVLWGREDQVLPVATLARFTAEIPRSRGAVIDNCGHVPYLEKPFQTISLYRDFLNSLN
jgi:pimeloyl-ACP methyl ester carboxylesterase